MTGFIVAGRTQRAALHVVQESGRLGMTYIEISRACHVSKAAASQALNALLHRGLVRFIEEPNDSHRTVRRFFDAGLHVKKAEPKGPVAAPRTGTLADPWGVTVAGHVIDAGQCRPWAAAAAACIGGARG